MNNKLFIFLVVVLSGLIIAAAVWLGISINKYNSLRRPKEKPDVLTEVNNTNKDNKIDTPEKTTTENKDNLNEEEKKSEYILPSDSKLLVETDLLGMDYDTLNKAYNEIFARHGHDFISDYLKEYFNKQSWYKPISGKTVQVNELSEIEAKNLTTIKSRIDKVK